jgi:hypothetical protein
MLNALSGLAFVIIEVSDAYRTGTNFVIFALVFRTCSLTAEHSRRMGQARLLLLIWEVRLSEDRPS